MYSFKCFIIILLRTIRELKITVYTSKDIQANDVTSRPAIYL